MESIKKEFREMSRFTSHFVDNYKTEILVEFAKKAWGVSSARKKAYHNYSEEKVT